MDVSRETPDVTTKPQCYNLTNTLVPEEQLDFNGPTARHAHRNRVSALQAASVVGSASAYGHSPD